MVVVRRNLPRLLSPAMQDILHPLFVGSRTAGNHIAPHAGALHTDPEQQNGKNPEQQEHGSKLSHGNPHRTPSAVS